MAFNSSGSIILENDYVSMLSCDIECKESLGKRVPAAAYYAKWEYVHEINDLISLVDTTLEKRNLLKNERANS
jgi:hypothetical protein